MGNKMSETNVTQMGQFNNVDATGEAERFIAFLEWIESLPQSTALRELSYSLLNIHQKDAVIDVGCGTGKAVSELSARGIEAIGLDISEQMISVSKRRFPECDFRIAKAELLPFGDNTMNGYRAERLYQHLADPFQALSEAHRILAPGGRIVLLDQDYDMWAIDADDMTITRSIMRAHADSITNRWIGRRYNNLLLDCGFTDVSIHVQTLIYTDYSQVAPILPSIVNAAVEIRRITEGQAEIWLKEQEKRGKNGRFFIVMPVFVASGIRP
jgi:ubiquinone/menaquinone biosynthesis C-methylase UbiE